MFLSINLSDNHYYEKFEDGKEKDITDEIPFEIPSTWTWTKLKHISLIVSGGTPSRSNKKYWNGPIPWIKIGDMTSKYINKASESITQDGLNHSSAKLLLKGTILYSIFASIGTVSILNIDAATNQAIVGITILGDYSKDFSYYILSGLKEFLISKGRGIAQLNINQTILSNMLIPVPPLKEQNKITSKIEDLYKRIDSINNSYNKINKLRDLLKSKIIDMAIKGELTNQLTTDEPSSKLIGKILDEKHKLMKEGKIKKENLSIIYKDTDNQFYEKFDDGSITNITQEIPFDIPNSWCWTRLKNISSVISKGTTPKGGKSAYVSQGINFIRAENVKETGIVSLKNLVYIDEKTHANYLKRSMLENKDILICIAGTLGRCGVIRENQLPANTNQAVSFVRYINKNDSFVEYSQFAINSFIIQKNLTNQTKVVAIPNLTLETIGNCLLPVPPSNEQLRIISKIEQLLTTLQ